MNFWTTMLATMLGFLIWDILSVIIKIVHGIWKDRLEEKTRKIGFGNNETDYQKTKSIPQMRKIGFGEND